MKQAAGKQASRMDKRKMRIALEQQHVVAGLVGGTVIPDNHAFDVLVARNLIEVKTVIGAKNDKITMHPRSLRQKIFTSHLATDRSFATAIAELGRYLMTAEQYKPRD